MRRNSVNLIFLVASNNNKYNLKDLSDHFEMSQRSIRYEIDNANYYLKSLGFNEIVMDSEKYYYVDLNEEEILAIKEEKLKNLYLLNPIERQTYILLMNLEASTCTLEEIGNYLEISKSTLDMDIRKIKELIKPFKLTFESNNDGVYRLEGDEWSKRQLLNELAIQTLDYEKLLDDLIKNREGSDLSTSIWTQYLGFENIRKIYCLMEKSWQNDSKSQNIIRLTQLTIFISIWFKRVVDGHVLIEEEIVINQESRVHTYEIVGKLIQELEISQSKDKFLEEYYLSYHIEGFDLLSNDTKYDWASLQLLTIKYIDLIEQLVGIKISEDKDLFNRLYNHFEAMAQRLDKSIVIKNPLESMIKNQYHDIYTAVNSANYLLEEFFEDTISDSEKTYITIHLSASKEEILSRSKRKYRVAVVCGHGAATGELLSQNLQKFFPIEVIAVLDVGVVNKIKRLDVDFIVSTIKMDIDSHEFIRVNPILKEYDKKAISRYLIDNPIEELEGVNDKSDNDFLNEVLQISLNKEINDKSKITKLEKLFIDNGLEVDIGGLQPMVSDVLDVNKIIIKESATDWKDAIKKVAQPLLNGGVIKEGYVTAMIDSVLEHGPYIVLDKGLALAHAKPSDDVNQVGLSVMTLAEPVKFNHEFNDPVEIIFCLSAVDSHSHLEIMRTLSLLINEREKLEDLIASETKEQFLESITRFENRK